MRKLYAKFGDTFGMDDGRAYSGARTLIGRRWRWYRVPVQFYLRYLTKRFSIFVRTVPAAAYTAIYLFTIFEYTVNENERKIRADTYRPRFDE